MGKVKEGFQIAGIGIGGIILIIALIFVAGGVGLWYKSTFTLKHADIDRDIFEESQSYTHGKIQDLAKYYSEYRQMSDLLEKDAMKAIINQQFAQFDSTKVKDATLRNFLKTMRGF